MSFADQSEREHPPKGTSVVQLLYGSKALRDAFSSVVKLYLNFVGPIHFRVMSRLLGYQGIAMILEQMLNITDAQVSTCNFTPLPFVASINVGCQTMLDY